MAVKAAAAEVFGLPCRVVPGQSGKPMRKLQLSNRDGEIRDYHFTVVPVEFHPDNPKHVRTGEAVAAPVRGILDRFSFLSGSRLLIPVGAIRMLLRS